MISRMSLGIDIFRTPLSILWLDVFQDSRTPAPVIYLAFVNCKNATQGPVKHPK
jgi:hypothetical protein